jgi:hypothetical protein
MDEFFENFPELQKLDRNVSDAIDALVATATEEPMDDWEIDSLVGGAIKPGDIISWRLDPKSPTGWTLVRFGVVPQWTDLLNRDSEGA